MQRNPYDVDEINYMKNIRSKKIRPRFSYLPCEKCGMEFKKEPMFQTEAKSYKFTFYHTYYGCSHCFATTEDFRHYLEEQHEILTHEDFNFLRELQNNDHISEKDTEKLIGILWA